jgi:hypothetical protein
VFVRPRPLEDEPEPETEAVAEPEPAPAPLVGGYRVAVDAQLARSAELEQKLGQMQDRMRDLEREVYAARKVVRRRRAMKAVATGGIGTTVGAVLAAILYAAGVISAPEPIFALLIVGFVLGALGGMRWEDPDDHFPDAPPVRFR